MTPGVVFTIYVFRKTTPGVISPASSQPAAERGGARDDRGSRSRVELDEDVRDVAVHGVIADEEALGDAGLLQPFAMSWTTSTSRRDSPPDSRRRAGSGPAGARQHAGRARARVPPAASRTPRRTCRTSASASSVWPRRWSADASSSRTCAASNGAPLSSRVDRVLEPPARSSSSPDSAASRPADADDDARSAAWTSRRRSRRARRPRFAPVALAGRDPSLHDHLERGRALRRLCFGARRSSRSRARRRAAGSSRSSASAARPRIANGCGPPD